MRTRQLLIAVGCLVLGVGLLVNPQDMAAGVEAGIRVGGEVLIPALFPFMALSSFMVMSGAAGILSAPLMPITRYVFRLPQEYGAVVLASLIGGYPVGGKMIATLLEGGSLDRPTAERMLSFCYGPSPSFIVTAVGAGMLLDIRLGGILFAAQIVASLIVGLGFSLGKPFPAAGSGKGYPAGGLAQAFVGAVSSAGGAMINMCAFAILFSGLLHLAQGGGVVGFISGLTSTPPEMVAAVIAGLFEVTSGSAAAAAIGGETGILLIGMFGAFGGFSVIFQVFSLFGQTRLNWKPFIVGRLAHTGLAGLMSVFFYRQFHGGSALMEGVRPIIAQDSRGLLGSALLILGCAGLAWLSPKAVQAKKLDIWR